MADSLNNAAPQGIVESDYYGRYDADEGTLLERFDRWDKRLEGHWSEWLEEARTCFDMVAGRQWDEDERTQMEANRRIPVVFNRIQPTIDAVAGAEIQGRQQVQYYPREVGDSAVSDILTQGAEYEMQACDGEEEDSDAFRDCLICGVGWTEMRPDTDDGEVMILKERVDPLEILADAGKVKANFSDARYLRRKKLMSEEEFKELWPDATPIGDDDAGKRRTIVDPTIRYHNGMLGDNDKGDVEVCEWQWWERESFAIVQGPNGEMEITDEQLEELLAVQPNYPHAKQTKKVFWRAFTSGPQILEVGEIKTGDFTYTAITGKRDRNKGVFYGLVRPMKDPQKFANKFFSQILHIINSNAKGGVMAEQGAVEDIRNFEESWASADAITWLKDGALAQNRILPKQAPAYPQGSDRLMQESNAAIRDVTGVNQEMLGLAERDQPGILEQQRKQQAYGILAAFFDARRRYVKMCGRKLLKYMREYLPEGKLVRIVGQDGEPQYVPMALTKDAAEYDIVVDEAPQSPNQKLQTWQMLVQMMPLLQNADLGASVWSELIRYSPLPAGLSAKLAKSLMDQEQQEAQAQAPQQQLAMRGAVAEVATKEGEAALKQAEAAHVAGEANSQPVRDTADMIEARAKLISATNNAVNDLRNRTETN